MGYELRGRRIGVRFSNGREIFFSPQHQFWNTPSPQSIEYREFLGVQLSGREAEHSFPPIAKIKNIWVYTTTPPYIIMWQRLIYYAKGQHHFTYVVRGIFKPFSCFEFNQDVGN
jgi:hypothetical protein